MLRPSLPLLILFTLALAPPLAHAATVDQQIYEQTLAHATTEPQVAMARAYADLLYVQSQSVPSAWAKAKLDAAKSPHPQVQVVLERESWRLGKDLGAFEPTLVGPVGRTSAHGCLTEFSWVGPFPNESMSNREVPLGPELGEVGPYEGKIASIDWRPLPQFSTLCALNLEDIVRPQSESVVYLANQVLAKATTKAVLLVGSDSAYQIWVNGKRVADQPQDHGLALDADGWGVTLRSGTNDVLVKLSHGQRQSADFQIRLVAAKDATPLHGLEVKPVWGRPRVDSVPPAPAPHPYGMGERAVRLTRNDDPRLALWGAGLLATTRPRDPAAPWRDVAERVEGAVRGQRVVLTPQEVVLLSELFSDHWQVLEVLERGQEVYPKDPQVLMELAKEYRRSLSLPTVWRAQKIYEALIAQAKTSLPHPMVTLTLADWWQDRGELSRALALLEGVEGEALAAPKAFAMAASLLEQGGKLRRLEALRAQHKEVLQDSIGILSRAYADAMRAGEFEQALEVTRTVRQRRPESVYWIEKEANVLVALDKRQEAIDLIQAELQQQQGEPDLHQRLASLQQSQGDVGGALGTLEALLVYTPQDQELRDKIAAMQPQQDRFYEPWMVKDVAAIAKTMPAGPFHTSTLVDQTLIRVAPNGLTQRVTQQVTRINTSNGLANGGVSTVYYQMGDEQVDVLGITVHKADGTSSRDYDVWRSENSRKASTTYNDSGSMTLRANNVEVGDIVEVRIQKSEVANQNFRGDYFGDLEYVQSTEPIGFLRYSILYPTQWSTLYFRAPKLPHVRKDGVLPDGSAPPKGYALTSFELTQTPRIKTERDQPGPSEVYDYILVSNKQTPTDIGTWWWNLIKEQLVVDETMRQTVVGLTKGLKTPEEKVKAIHNYVVQNTRYLHVGLGIHGWKPYRTTTCFRNRYGDCKDKAALLKVMLEAAGVPANLVLVRTRDLGNLEMKPAAMMVFNHAIAYVPSLDLFLDGTAEYNGTGELVTMDQGAYGLIVEDGGRARLVNLPIDKAGANVQTTKLVVDLRGPMPKATLEMVVEGADASRFRAKLEDAERRNETIETYLASQYKGAKLLDATTSEVKNLEQPVHLKATFETEHFAKTSGSSILLAPLGQPVDLLSELAPQDSRDQPRIIRVPFTSKTQMTYLLPPTTTPSSVPQSRQITSPFGQATLEYSTATPGQLAISVTYSIEVPRVSVEAYPEFRAFVHEVNAALNQTIEVQ